VHFHSSSIKSQIYNIDDTTATAHTHVSVSILTAIHVTWHQLHYSLLNSDKLVYNGSYTSTNQVSQCPVPFLAQWCQTVTFQTVQGHTGLTHPFKFFHIRVLWHSGLSARVPECQKIGKGGLDLYGTKRFGRLIFATIRKSVGLKE